MSLEEKIEEVKEVWCKYIPNCMVSKYSCFGRQWLSERWERENIGTQINWIDIRIKYDEIYKCEDNTIALLLVIEKVKEEHEDDKTIR